MADNITIGLGLAGGCGTELRAAQAEVRQFGTEAVSVAVIVALGFYAPAETAVLGRAAAGFCQVRPSCW